MSTSMSASGFKSYVGKQNLVGLSIGLFVMYSVWAFVKSVYANLFKPIAQCISDKITGRLNLQNVSFGCPGVRFDAVANEMIELVVALAVAFVVSKSMKVSGAKIPVMFSLGA